MKTSTILVLTLSLCIITGPTAAGPSCDVNTDEAFNILDIVQMVTAILGDDELLCAGPGCDICPDITSDNDASYDAGYAESCLDAGLTLDCA